MRFPKKIHYRRIEATIYGRKPNYPFYRVAYYVAGKRHLRNFKTYQEAKSEAERKVREIGDGSQAAALNANQSRDALAAFERLETLHQSSGRRVSLLAAVSELAEAMDKLRGRTLGEAVEGYLRTVVSIQRKGLPALAACAAAIGDARAVQVKAGWIEFPVLWTLSIAPSGSLKTPAMKAAMHGLQEAQKRAFEQHRLAEAKYKTLLADWIKRDKKGAEPIPPQLASYYIGDATLESIGVLLDINPRGLLLMRDELSGWLGGFDKYSEGNEAAQWLEFHSGNSVRIDRKGGDKKTIYIPRALVCVTGTIQEPVLRKLLSGGDAKHFDNGLAARIIMTMPPERTRQWREAITPPALTQKYADLFCDLLKLTPDIDKESGRREPVILKFSPEAKARFVNFVNTHGAEMRGFKSDRLKSAWSKLEGQAARLALVFHCVREAYLPSPGDNAKTISADTLDAALVWIEWLKNETRRIYYTLTHKGDTRQADKLIAFARRNGGSITARDAARVGIGGGDAAVVEKIMAGLVTAGLAEWHKQEQPKGGRPTRHFRLKPAVAQSDNSTPSSETDKTPM